jgi:Helix-turn-helix domain (DUF4817)
MSYSTEENIFVTKKYDILNSVSLVQRAWRTKFKNYKAPGRYTIVKLTDKFNKTGSVDNLTGKNRKISQKRKDTKIVLEGVVAEKPDLSINEAAQVAGISRELARMVLKEDLNLKPHKLHQYHELKPSDPAKRLDFCIWFKGLSKITSMRLICSNKAYFCLTKPVNKQNNRLWLKTRPSKGVERQLYDQKQLVLCTMLRKRIYGTYYFEGTINLDSFISMLKYFFGRK